MVTVWKINSWWLSRKKIGKLRREEEKYAKNSWEIIYDRIRMIMRNTKCNLLYKWDRGNSMIENKNKKIIEWNYKIRDIL